MYQEGGPAALLRRERAQRAVARLGESVGGWLAGWSDAKEQLSQIQRVATTLSALLERLSAAADQIAASTAGFAAAREVDADLATVERLWRHYAERFDQRRRGELAATLRAADEVIWSCAVQARELAPAGQILPLPLAYLEPTFSPTAIPRSEPLPELVATDPKLARILRTMPVPLIGLPTAVVDEPWWLVLVAHEVGHHVQYDLEPADALIGRTADILVAIPDSDADADLWQAWSKEVFADAFSVATLGAAAIDAIVELEWDSADAMAENRGRYPPVLIRLGFMAALARTLAIEPAAVTGESLAATVPAIADPAARDQAGRWLGHAAQVAGALAAMPIGTGTLATLATRCRAAVGGDDAALEKVLAGSNLGVGPGRTRPLRAVAAAFRSYCALAGVDAAARDRGRDGLRQRTAPLIERVRDQEIRRSVTRSSGEAEAAAQTAMVDRIMAAMRAPAPPDGASGGGDSPAPDSGGAR